MESRPLGRTGLTVTRLGLGLAAVGRPAYITAARARDLGEERSEAALERRAHEVLTAAYDAGVRYFDVARSYGSAEQFLSRWLRARQLAPGDVTVGSKWGYRYVGDWRIDAPLHEVKDHSLAALSRQLVESRRLLDGFLNLYQIHSATLESGVLEDRAVLSALTSLRQEGLTIGLSVSGPRQPEAIDRALAVEIDGVNPFQSVQATWNLLEPSAGPAMARAHDAGWGVIIKEALANGRLAAEDQVAIAAALANPWADVVLSGAVSAAQVTSNVGALDLGVPPEAVEFMATRAEPPEQYWRDRGQRAWA